MFFFRKKHQRRVTPGYVLSILLILLLLLLPAVYTVLTKINSAEATIVPIANWKFDEGYGTTTAETISNGNTGTLAGTTVPTWQTEDQCIAGKCLFFDGSTSKVTVAGSVNFKSVSMWVRPISVSSGALADFGSNIRITVSSGVLSATGFTSPTIYVDGNVNTTLVANKWQHVTVTTGTNVAGASMQFGVYSTTFLNGYLDEIRMYTDQQTATVVKGDFTARNSQRTVSAQIGKSSNDFLNQNLVGYWKMDESSWTIDCSTNSVLDSSGNNLHGHSCPLTTGPAGGSSVTKYNRAGLFDGSNDYVEVSDNDTLDMSATDSFTISVWVDRTSASGSENIISKKATTCTAGNVGWGLSIISAKYHLCADDGTNNIDAQSGTSYTQSIYQNIIVVFDRKNNTVAMYVNGVQDTVTLTGTVSSVGSMANTRNLTFATASNITSYLTGNLDEIRIYKRALSAVEAKQLYYWAPPPVGWWKLDDNTGTTAYDSSGNGYNGTFHGTTTWVPGKYGSGVNTNVASSYIDTTDPANGNLDFGATDDFTLMAWVRSTTAASQIFIYKDFGTSHPGYRFRTDSSGRPSCDLSDGTTSDSNSGTTTITDGNWHHIACVRLGSAASKVVYIYVDGILDDAPIADSTTLTLANDVRNLEISANSSTSYWPGDIDDVKVYRYPRTPNQIVEDMNAGNPLGNTLGSQIANWKFDEAQGTTVNNSAPNIFATVLSNGPLWASPANCKYNSCLDFDGTDDVLTVTNEPAIDMDIGLKQGVTYSAWIRPDTVGEGSAGEIFRKSATTFCKLGGSTPFNLSCSLDLGTDATVTVNSVIPASTWTYVTMAWTDDADDEISVYVNGVLRGTSTNGVGPNTADTSNLSIGGGTTNNFDGKIDEFKIYNSELSQAQILNEMNANSSANFGTGQLESSQLTDSTGNPPRAYWRMDENTGTTVSDTSGNGFSASTTNMTSQWVNGKQGSALSFDGSDDYVSTSSTSVWDTSAAFTAEAWIYPKSYGEGNAGQIMGKDGAFAIFLEQSSGNGTNTVTACFGACSAIADATDNSVTLNTWQHVVVTSDGAGTWAFYINGINKTDDSTLADSTSAVATVIGADVAGTTSFTFDGYIDDVKIYDYVRTPGQIEYDYNRGEPVAWYKMDECTGTTLNSSASIGGLAGTWTGTASGSNTSAGTCSSGTSTQAWNNGTTGKRNASLDFDGTDDVVTVTNDTPIDFDLGLHTGATFAAWVNPATVGESSAGEIFRKSATTFCKLGGSTPFNLSCSLDLSTDATVTINSMLPANTWSHVAMVWADDADDEIDVYVNGKLVGSSTNGVGPNTADASNLLIGGGTSNNFDGQIDDFKVFNYALSQTQIVKLMNENSGARFGPDTGSP